MIESTCQHAGTVAWNSKGRQCVVHVHEMDLVLAQVLSATGLVAVAVADFSTHHHQRTVSYWIAVVALYGYGVCIAIWPPPLLVFVTWGISQTCRFLLPHRGWAVSSVVLWFMTDHAVRWRTACATPPLLHTLYYDLFVSAWAVH